jgi:hypothetical protein
MDRERPITDHAFPSSAGDAGGGACNWLRFWHFARPDMSNRAIWSMKKRHEWLATPLKKRRVKRATRVRCGLQEAIDRKAGTAEPK